jgi:hypothetical protein
MSYWFFDKVMGIWKFPVFNSGCTSMETGSIGIYVFCTPGTRKPPPTALPGAKKPRNTQKRYETIRGAMDSGGRRSPRGAPTPPHGWFGPRQRSVHHRGHVDGPRTQLYHPHLGTWAPPAVGFGRGRRFYRKIWGAIFFFFFLNNQALRRTALLQL